MLCSKRPQRTSKQKAVNQVRAWCGDMEDEDGLNAHSMYTDDEDDSDDSFEKKIKEEEDTDSDLSEDDEPFVPIIRKSAPKSVDEINGADVAKIMAGSMPVVPGGSRIVRVSQKHLPSLSSGVYIMSKTDGIIKLDSNTSQAITNSGQVIKVGSKIGQTQIKVSVRLSLVMTITNMNFVLKSCFCLNCF